MADAVLDQLREKFTKLTGTLSAAAGDLPTLSSAEIHAAAEDVKSQISGIRGEIEKAGGPKPEWQRLGFVDKYQIQVLDIGQVAFTVTNPIEFLEEAQEISIKLHAADPKTWERERAIWLDCLEAWKADADFKALRPGAVRAIDGNVQGSTNKTRKEQEAKGWNNVSLCELAIAHAAYFLATGKDLFGNNVVRARGGALRFHAYGLYVNDSYVVYRSYDVAASSALPPRN